jgi:hypothetical protein
MKLQSALTLSGEFAKEPVPIVVNQSTKVTAVR